MGKEKQPAMTSPMTCHESLLSSPLCFGATPKKWPLLSPPPSIAFTGLNTNYSVQQTWLSFEERGRENKMSCQARIKPVQFINTE